jgi:dimethylargininase
LRVFDFNQAIVRRPGASAVRGLRSDSLAIPALDGILREHTLYVDALLEAGLVVDILPPLEDFPDSVFVEDPALVLPEGAILLRPGAPSRLGETVAMRDALRRHFADVPALEGDGYADGGDVLVTPRTIFIGISARTNRRGAAALAARLAALGRKAEVVATPAGVLHFKTAVSLLDEDTVLATRRMAESGIFRGYRVLVVPEGEEAAANALRVNDVVLLGEAFVRTRDLLAEAGFAMRALSVAEIGKLDAGLSCMSLRWLKPLQSPAA